MTMRLVAVADTHLYHGELVVPDGDLFVHAGDLCRGGDLDELAETLSWIRGLPHRRKLIIAGNHDWAFAKSPAAARALIGRDLIYLEDESVIVDGLRFYGSPWQPAYNDWAFNVPRGAALAQKWSRVPHALDVLVTHGPPHGIGDRGPVPGRLGCEDLLARVREAPPRLHLFGHIHQDGGFWQVGPTRFSNVTTWECERPPTVIDIDDRAITPIAVPPPHPKATS